MIELLTRLGARQQRHHVRPANDRGEVMMVIQQQQWQIQQLTHSVNQCYQSILAMQREMSNLMLSMQQGRSRERSGYSSSDVSNNVSTSTAQPPSVRSNPAAETMVSVSVPNNAGAGNHRSQVWLTIYLFATKFVSLPKEPDYVIAFPSSKSLVVVSSSEGLSERLSTPFTHLNLPRTWIVS